MKDLKGLKFKAIRPVQVTHERGTEKIELVGEVISNTSEEVVIEHCFIKVPMTISMSDFQNQNKFKN